MLPINNQNCFHPVINIFISMFLYQNLYKHKVIHAQNYNKHFSLLWHAELSKYYTKTSQLSIRPTQIRCFFIFKPTRPSNQSFILFHYLFIVHQNILNIKENLTQFNTHSYWNIIKTLLQLQNEIHFVSHINSSFFYSSFSIFWFSKFKPFPPNREYIYVCWNFTNDLDM